MSLDQSNSFKRNRDTDFGHQEIDPPSPNHVSDRQHHGSRLDAKDPSPWDEDISDTRDTPSSNAVVRITDVSQLNLDQETDDVLDDRDAISVSELAPEILTKVLAFLDPVSLSRSAAVCRSWAVIARDDATWRAAFATYFNLEAAEGAESSVIPSLRRMSTMSWKTGFQQRSDLLRRWRKSRAPTVLSTPKVDMIKRISISKQHSFMLSASEMYGVASRSNPFTGKVTKGYLDAEGTANGAGNGNPNVEFSPNVTALAMSADANNVVWGFRSGEVGMTTLSRQGTNPRGAIKSHKFSPRGTHAGPVTGIALPFPSYKDSVHGAGRSPERLRQRLSALGDVATTFVSSGHDGTVRLWSSLRPLPLWVASTAAAPAANAGSTSGAGNAGAPQIAAPICALDYDAQTGIIVAGNTAGKVFAFYNLDVAAMLAIPPEATDPEHAEIDETLLQAQRTFAALVSSVKTASIEFTPGWGAETALSTLLIDARPSAKLGLQQTFSVLAHHSGAPVFLRHAVDASAVPAARTTVYGTPGMDEITAIRADFEPRLATIRSSVSSPMVSVSASPVLSSLSVAGAGESPIPHLVIGPSISGPSQYSERKFVYVGTSSGHLHLFAWDLPSSSPALTIAAHHTRITCLEVTCLHVIAGTSDGTVKVFCALSGELVRSINDRTAQRNTARMLAAGELTESESARFRVTQVVADHDSVVAAVGHQVLAFRAEVVRKPVKKTGKTQMGGGGRGLAKAQLQSEVRESQAMLAREREEQERGYERLRERARVMELGDLSEQEQIDYAMMLSREAERATPSSSPEAEPTASPGGSGSQEEDDLRLAIALSLSEDAR